MAKTKAPEHSVVLAATRIDERAAELEASGEPARRALIIALLEVAPDILREIDRLDDAAIRNRAATANAAAVESTTRDVRLLIKNAKIQDAEIIRRIDLDDVGRDGVLIGFDVLLGSKRASVTMPERQDRGCRINGSSWTWQFAPGELREVLGLSNLPEVDRYRL